MNQQTTGTRDRIERSIDLAAPVSRVWEALTDHDQFGTWFRVRIDAPFEIDGVARGTVTYPGYEHLPWEATIVAMEPERRFAFTWHPYAVDPDTDYSAEPTTLVEFLLTPTAAGTRLQVVESGFRALPSGRYAEALRMNEGGWAEQMDNIQRHVEA